MIKETIYNFYLEKRDSTLLDLIKELKTIREKANLIIFSYSKDFADRIGLNCIEKTSKTKLDNEFVVFKDKTLTIRDISVSQLILELEKIYEDNPNLKVNTFKFGRAKLYININFK